MPRQNQPNTRKEGYSAERFPVLEYAFHRDREVRPPFHRSIIRHDRAFDTLNVADTGDDTAAGR